jgi:quercetin dioxygenase-like cupin family protein
MVNNISDLYEKQIIEGITGRYIHGQNSSFGLVKILKGSTLPVHHHHHEQITFILEGELEMTIGGETITLKAGDYFVIPSNVPHSAIAHMDCRLIDVFSPVREEYK